jgi:hypothetical protein
MQCVFQSLVEIEFPGSSDSHIRTFLILYLSLDMSLDGESPSPIYTERYSCGAAIKDCDAG